MNKNEYFETDIPSGYVLVKHIDAKNDKKTMTAYSLLALVPPVVLLPVFCIIAEYGGYDILENLHNDIESFKLPILLLILCAVNICYIVLHEITHGIVYKIFTGAKLKFGLTLTVAFCGVPDIYVRKKASFASLIMPFAVFSVIFGVLTPILWRISPLYGIFSGIVFAIHLGGCVGDLHWILMYLTEFRHCTSIMRDTGPQQWLYVPMSQAVKYAIPYSAAENEKNSQLRISEDPRSLS